MLAEFSIHPAQQKVAANEMTRLIETLAATGLHYHLGPTSIAIEGCWAEVLEAIHRCHQKVTMHNDQVITTIIIEDRKDDPLPLHLRIEQLTAETKRCGPRQDMDPQW